VAAHVCDRQSTKEFKDERKWCRVLPAMQHINMLMVWSLWKRSGSVGWQECSGGGFPDDTTTNVVQNRMKACGNAPTGRLPALPL
jgi:hypothetical protein